MGWTGTRVGHLRKNGGGGLAGESAWRGWQKIAGDKQRAAIGTPEIDDFHPDGRQTTVYASQSLSDTQDRWSENAPGD